MKLLELIQDELYPTILVETDLGRILGHYMENGFIVISANRTPEAQGAEKSKEILAAENQNKINEKKLRAAIRAANFGYVPAWGGYKEKDPNTGNLIDSSKSEPSYIITAKHLAKDKIRSDYNTLFNFGVELSNEFNQDSFLWKPPSNIDSNAYWIDKNGNIVNTFTNIDPNNLAQEYFTQLRKGSKRRFTLTEFYIRKNPSGPAEARTRYGEIFYKNVKHS